MSGRGRCPGAPAFRKGQINLSASTQNRAMLAAATRSDTAASLDREVLDQHAADVLILGCTGVAVIYSVIVTLSLVSPTSWDTPLTVSVTASGALIGWSLRAWLAVRTVSAATAHRLLFALVLVMGVQTGTVLFLIGQPIHSGNQTLVLLDASFFLADRRWFYPAVAVVLLGWLPAAVTHFADPEHHADWVQWSRMLLISTALAIAFFEARRLSVLRSSQLRLNAETALAHAQEANDSRLSMQRMMQDAQRREALGVLAGGIAHDFNNLLAVIKGNLELLSLLEPPTVPSEATAQERSELIEEMDRACTRAVELTAQMLVYAGRSRPAISTLLLGERIRSAVQLMASSTPANVRVRLLGDGEGPELRVDSTLIDQLILNVIRNAIEACEDRGGRVDLHWRLASLDATSLSVYEFNEPPQPGPYAVLEVSDNGRGMDEATRTRMFEPFYSNKPGGHGLGLAVVTGILQAHGAGFTVSSQPEQGTTLRLALPAGTGT